MKTHNLVTQILLASTLAALAAGCAKQKADVSSAAPIVTPTGGSGVGPGTPSRDGSGNVVLTNGDTVELQKDSLAALTAYVAIHPLNNPTNLKVSMQLAESSTGTNKFTGQVFISYYDNGQNYTGKFYAQNTTVANGYSHGHDGKNYGEYNRWFTWGGKQVFHGFFQDSYGAIMVIVNDSINLGDGAGNSELSGEIWYKNFATSYATQGNIPCWFIEQGPYDCRTFMVDSETVMTTSALYPTQSAYFTSTSNNPNIPAEPARGWRRLGTFGGLNKQKAFGL